MRIRAYDIEPKPDRSPLPEWTADFTMEEIPFSGDEMKIVDNPGGPHGEGETHYWMVVRRTYEPGPFRNGETKVVLAVRFVQ